MMRTRTLSLDTSDRQIVDLTGDVRAFVHEEAGDAILVVFVPHATAGLAIVETGSGTEADLLAAVSRLLPRGTTYEHAHGTLGHGADHVLPAFLSPSLTLVVERGEVWLGTWQSVVLVDTNRDNPQRQVRFALTPA